MNRRNFLSGGLSIIVGATAAILLPRSAKAKEGWSFRRIFVVHGLREPIVVMGGTPAHLIKGKLGTTYSRAGVCELPRGQRVYFNGNDVNRNCSEVDLEGQWVRLYDVQNDGDTPVMYRRNLLTGRVSPVKVDDDLWQKHRRNPITGQHEKTIEFFLVERIHFGKVEVR